MHQPSVSIEQPGPTSTAVLAAEPSPIFLQTETTVLPKIQSHSLAPSPSTGSKYVVPAISVLMLLTLSGVTYFVVQKPRVPVSSLNRPIFLSVSFTVLIASYLIYKFRQYKPTSKSLIFPSKSTILVSCLSVVGLVGSFLLLRILLNRLGGIRNRRPEDILATITEIHRLSFGNFMLIWQLLISPDVNRVITSEESAALREFTILREMITPSTTVGNAISLITSDTNLVDRITDLYKVIYTADEGNELEAFFNLTTRCYFLSEQHLIALFAYPFRNFHIHNEAVGPTVGMFQVLYPDIFTGLNGDETIRRLIVRLPDPIYNYLPNLETTLLLPYLNTFYPQVAQRALIENVMMSSYVTSSDTPDDLARKRLALDAKITQLLSPESNDIHLAVLGSMLSIPPVFPENVRLNVLLGLIPSTRYGSNAPTTVDEAIALLRLEEQALLSRENNNQFMYLIMMKHPAVPKILVLSRLSRESDPNLQPQFDEIFERLAHLNCEQLTSILGFSDFLSYNRLLTNNIAAAFRGFDERGEGRLRNIPQPSIIQDLISHLSPAEQVFFDRTNFFAPITFFILLYSFYQ